MEVRCALSFMLVVEEVAAVGGGIINHNKTSPLLPHHDVIIGGGIWRCRWLKIFVVAFALKTATLSLSTVATVERVRYSKNTK